MANFNDLLKKWFYNNNSQAASSDARVALLNSDGTPKGSDTMANLASVLGATQQVIVELGGNAIISKTTRGGGVLLLAENGTSGANFVGYVNWASDMTNLLSDSHFTYGESSNGNYVLYYDSNYRLHLKYNRDVSYGHSVVTINFLLIE